MLPLIQFHCNVTNEEEIVQILVDIAHGQHNKRACTRTIQAGHLPLHTPFHKTTTLLRRPLTRIASGFLHNFHECAQMQRKFGVDPRANVSISMAPFCQDIKEYSSAPEGKNYTPGKIVDDQNQTYHVLDVILDYAKCVRGCTTNMLTKKRCAMGAKYSVNSTVVMQATSVISRLAFVGVTDDPDWGTMLCQFQHKFPRKHGGGYSMSRHNIRPSPVRACEHDLIYILNATTKWIEEYDPDYVIYQAGARRFQKELLPICRDQRES